MFATKAIVYTTRMSHIVTLPSRVMVIIELGQSVASNWPNPEPNSFQRSRSTAGTSNPRTPHHNTHFHSVSFMRRKLMACCRDVQSLSNKRRKQGLTLKFRLVSIHFTSEASETDRKISVIERFFANYPLRVLAGDLIRRVGSHSKTVSPMDMKIRRMMTKNSKPRVIA